MSRTSLKRTISLCDSPASSTPPQPPAKRHHSEASDASSDDLALHYLHLPSDSPSNPFGRFKPFAPRGLPPALPVSDHLVLRFRLASQPHNVQRVVCLPATYTFWHLSRLVQFLFGWKEYRTERSSRNRHEKIKRRVKHVFSVQKDVVLYPTSKSAGLIKSGRTAIRVIGNIKDVEGERKPNMRWEREECYALHHVWHRPGSNTEMSRAIIYEYDAFTAQRELVYISMFENGERLRRRSHPEVDELSNLPYVLLGCGLPDDDEDDDEDFALDLQQWNEPRAFDEFIHGQDAEDDRHSEDDSSCPSSSQLAEEQARVKRRMSGPLPKRLPLDDDEDTYEVDANMGQAKGARVITRQESQELICDPGPARLKGQNKKGAAPRKSILPPAKQVKRKNKTVEPEEDLGYLIQSEDEL